MEIFFKNSKIKQSYMFMNIKLYYQFIMALPIGDSVPSIRNSIIFQLLFFKDIVFLEYLFS
jgi:hypothetical protein